MHPELTARPNETRIIKRPGFHIQDVGMNGGYRIHGGPALRTEIPSQGVAAIAVLGKPFWVSRNDVEVASFNPNSGVESAPSASSAIFAMAIVRRPKVTFTLISHASA